MSQQNAKINLTRLTYLTLYVSSQLKKPKCQLCWFSSDIWSPILWLYWADFSPAAAISTRSFHKAQPHIHKTSTGEYLPPVHFHGQNQTVASSSKAICTKLNFGFQLLPPAKMCCCWPLQQATANQFPCVTLCTAHMQHTFTYAWPGLVSGRQPGDAL